MSIAFLRAVVALGLALPAFAHAQSVSIIGGAPPTQTFDTLANTGTSSTLPTGWFFVESGSNADTTYAADNGGVMSGNTYSYGTGTATERAFGTLRSNSNGPTIGARLSNDTGTLLNELQIEYEGEQWRIGTLARADRLDFQYSLDATSLTTGTWTNVDALDFTSPNTTGPIGALDGNLGANGASKSAVVTGLALASGATMWVRWSDFDPGTNEDGLALDNVVFSVPGDNPPGVSTTTPADGATAVARDASIAIQFSEPVTTTDPWFTLSCGASGAHAATVSGSGANRTIDPTVDFAFDEECTLTIDAASVADLDAPIQTMTADRRVVFRTLIEPVDTRPAVDSTVPANGASNVAVNGNVTVKFTENVTLGASWFTLSCATSGAHTAVVTGGPSQYTINPDVDFTHLEQCTLTVVAAQVTDLDGTPDTMASDATTTFTTSAAPGNYYAGVDASSCVALRTTLHATIDDHTVHPYTGSPTDVWTMLEAGDQDPNDSGKVLDVYFNKSFTKVTDRDSGTSVPQGTRYNREHTWPQSYGFSATNGNLGFPNAPRSDAHMLYASEKDWNADRGNKPFADCPPPGCAARHTLIHPLTGGAGSAAACDHASGNCNWVGGPDGNSGSFEVWTRRKGDIARAVLYMDVRYAGGVATGGNTSGQSEPDLIVTDNRSLIAITSSSPAYMGLKATLIAWHALDPPDAQEQLRNDTIFSFQANRNPFIDHPEWVAIAFADPCTGSPPTNQPPVYADATRSVLENAANGTTVATLTATDPDAGQTLAYSIVSGNTGNAFALAAGTGTLTVADTTRIDPAVAASYTLVLRATDNGSPTMSDDATVTVNVTPINDAPSFTKGADRTVAEDAGAQSFGGWATGMSTGPADESTQTLSFEVTANTNAPLFAAAPAVAANGSLTFTPAADASGTATISLRARDTGGTANGGVDASAVQTFTITVSAVNDAPVASGASGSVAQGAAPGTPVVTVGATDVDGPALAYAITAGNTGGAFAIDTASGAITVATSAAVTTSSSPFALTVTVRDGGAPEQSDSATVTITVTPPPADALFSNSFE